MTEEAERKRGTSEVAPIGDSLSWSELTIRLETLPDGREVIVFGDVEELSELVHQQGENTAGFLGTCGLVSVEGILRRMGIETSETAVVEYAREHGLCYSEGSPEMNGGTSIFDQVLLLRDHGVGAFIDAGDSTSRLAMRIEEGRGVIAEVNAGVLWDRAEYYGEGSANHAIVVTGTARDPNSGDLSGFFINDSAMPPGGRFVDVETMRAAFVDAGGLCVCTDALNRREPTTMFGAAPVQNGTGPRFHF